MDRKNILTSRFSDKCKNGLRRRKEHTWKIVELNHKNLLDERDHFYL